MLTDKAKKDRLEEALDLREDVSGGTPYALVVDEVFRLRGELKRARASEKRLAEEVRAGLDDLLRGYSIEQILEKPGNFAEADGGVRGAIVSLAALKRIAAALSEVEE